MSQVQRISIWKTWSEIQKVPGAEKEDLFIFRQKINILRLGDRQQRGEFHRIISLLHSSSEIPDDEWIEYPESASVSYSIRLFTGNKLTAFLIGNCLGRLVRRTGYAIKKSPKSLVASATIGRDVIVENSVHDRRVHPELIFAIDAAIEAVNTPVFYAPFGQYAQTLKVSNPMPT